ncbi:MAG TPA: GNAT family N-acetyltransferase [Chloroflexota bacterium]|nr:GNAT family N-acetyltransferase [Chloroflexota bacterium]
MGDHDAAAGGVVIRGYRPEDRERVKELTIAGFAGVAIEYLIEERWPGASPLDWGERKFGAVDADLAAHPETCFVAEAGGEMIGYITTTVSAATGQGRIPDLAVDSAWRGRGIGRRLIEHALSFFREQGLTIARIETLSHNAIGSHLYPELGFELIATQKHFARKLS